MKSIHILLPRDLCSKRFRWKAAHISFAKLVTGPCPPFTLGTMFLLHRRAANSKTHTLTHILCYQLIRLATNTCPRKFGGMEDSFKSGEISHFYPSITFAQIGQYLFHKLSVWYQSIPQVNCHICNSLGDIPLSPSCLQFAWTYEMFWEGLNLMFSSLAPLAHLAEFLGKDRDRCRVLNTGLVATPVTRSLPETSTLIDLYVQRHS